MGDVRERELHLVKQSKDTRLFCYVLGEISHYIQTLKAIGTDVELLFASHISYLHFWELQGEKSNTGKLF